uniref:Uncharacterized protein n=1 Tax=Picea glauca TaxID=3330 RepID=A0A101LYF9_PICGL|nr:hypothetical protein ABT39_MTgene5836 [Picea glauca]
MDSRVTSCGFGMNRMPPHLSTLRPSIALAADNLRTITPKTSSPPTPTPIGSHRIIRNSCQRGILPFIYGW